MTTEKETRTPLVYSRREGAIGYFKARPFTVQTTVGAKKPQLDEEIIAAVREQGFETHHIIEYEKKDA